MLSVAEANALVVQLLGDTPRAAHTRVVGHLMGKLAVHLSEDASLWEVVGLCHDLDYLETAADRTQHGVLAAQWLGDLIPASARQAIAGHDHRTGVKTDTLLADMLKAADAAAVIDHRLGRQVWRELDDGDPLASLRNRLGDRAYLGDVLHTHASKHALPFRCIMELMRSAPPQQADALSAGP
jgi:hypothetical protein